MDLNTLLQQGISEPVFNGDLVYKFKRTVGIPDQFKKITNHCKRVGYSMNIMRKSACQVIYLITVYTYGFLFNCTTRLIDDPCFQCDRWVSVWCLSLAGPTVVHLWLFFTFSLTACELRAFYLFHHNILIVSCDSTLNGPRHEKTCLRVFAKITGADQPAHPRSPINAFIIRFFKSIICKLATGKISIF